jgi:mannose-1-phosphate guanylyltransferase
MTDQRTVERSGGSERPASARGQLWGIVLAGGEGVRLRPLARQICGDERPNQYVPLFDGRTLLRQTLDRVGLGIPLARTVIVTLRSHARYFIDQVKGSEPPHVLVQPLDRGTTAGILFPVHWAFWHDPDATVAVFPSDHFVLEEATFMEHVVRVAAWVNEHPDRLVLLGAHATEAEVEYGWIEPGRPLAPPPDVGIWEIRRFWEKPPEDTARLCLASSCLWNTFVLIGRASTFLRASHEAVPEVNDRLSRIAPFLGSEDEAWAIHQAYALLPKANFSRWILEPCPPFLAVSELPPLTWSDLGSPRRVLDVLRRARSASSLVLASDLAAS